MTKWNFYCGDNSGKHQHFIVTAADKQTAIKKAFERARKNASGDITTWDCKLKISV